MLVRIGGLRRAKNFPKFFGRKAAEQTSSNAVAVTGALTTHASLRTPKKPSTFPLSEYVGLVWTKPATGSARHVATQTALKANSKMVMVLLANLNIRHQ